MDERILDLSRVPFAFRTATALDKNKRLRLVEGAAVKSTVSILGRLVGEEREEEQGT